jgi:hypothetical protein
MLDHWFLCYLQLVLSLCSSTSLLCSLSGIASSCSLRSIASSCTRSRKLWRWIDDLSSATASSSLNPFKKAMTVNWRRWIDDLSSATASSSLNPFKKAMTVNWRPQLGNCLQFAEPFWTWCDPWKFSLLFLSSFSCFHPELVVRSANGSGGLSSLTCVAWLFSASSSY